MFAPKTYTREDVAEFQCHGGEESLRRVLAAAIKAGARAAEPGEFTKRAFLNGRIDLAQAEAVMDMVSASSERARAAALDQLSGRLSNRINMLYDSILTELAGIEAAIDDPEHKTGDDGRKDRINAIKQDADTLLSTFEYGRVCREGINTVIFGKPNVGKSSILNCLLGQDRAIVTEIPGTTRDILKESIRLKNNGLVLNLTDTAGIRKTDETVESIGVERAREAAAGADLVLCVLDGSAELSREDEEIISQLRALNTKVIYVINKSDLPKTLDSSCLAGADIICISAKYMTNIDSLIRVIEERFTSGKATEETVLITSARHAGLLRETVNSLENARIAAEQDIPEDFISIDLTEACGYLAKICGRDAGEDLVNSIFDKFCIGK
jgi:tRNA modification GTPase